VDLTSDDVSPTNSSTNQYGTLNAFSIAHDGGQSSNTHVQGYQEVEPTTSASSGRKGEEPMKKGNKVRLL
jgi:hypothetical protein